ncbi:MAG: hypothetical protein ACSLFP_01290 [Acidimicrobiales bacterium]
MTSWGVTGGVVAFLLFGAACADDDGTAATTTVPDVTTTVADTTTSTTSPERPPSTTTTAFDPASLEGEVEAAYLRSWEVYADAVYDLELDEAALAEVYADEHLETKRNEIEGRIADGRAALVLVEHDYTIEFVDNQTAVIIDVYVNHQVLIDPDTKEPVEADPNERLVDATTARLIDGEWLMTDLTRL